MVREWYMRRGLQLLVRERACGEVYPPSCETIRLLPGRAGATEPQLDTFYLQQNIHQRLFDFVVTCR